MPFRVARNAWDLDRAMSNSGIRKTREALRKAADLPWLRIHDLRHTAITRMAEAGVPIPVILSMAGHISTRMQQHYTAVSEPAKRCAVEAARSGGNYIISAGRLTGERVPVQKTIQVPETRGKSPGRAFRYGPRRRKLSDFFRRVEWLFTKSRVFCGTTESSPE